jgi:hypothetical protein
MNNVFIIPSRIILLPFKTINFQDCLNHIAKNIKMMKNNNQNDKPKTPGNEDYDINHPQNITKPAFRSDSGSRDSSGVPGTENLNHQIDDNDQLEAPTADATPASQPKNDERLFGGSDKTDLGNDDDDEKDNEKLIRE